MDVLEVNFFGSNEVLCANSGTQPWRRQYRVTASIMSLSYPCLLYPWSNVTSTSTHGVSGESSINDGIISLFHRGTHEPVALSDKGVSGGLERTALLVIS